VAAAPAIPAAPGAKIAASRNTAEQLRDRVKT